MTRRIYTTPAAFKQALEQRIREAVDFGPEIARKRQRLVFDRFLARIVDVLRDTVILKGGLALELRLDCARSTKDIDLRVEGSPSEILAKLRTAAAADLGDFMLFEVHPDDRHPAIQGEGMKYQGLRFRTECKLAGKIYGSPFGVDVGYGDPILGRPQVLRADDMLAFAGIRPPEILAYPIETHIAEKLHAYTMPRAHTNSRVKDLPDLALLASTDAIHAQDLREALCQTFSFRATHPAPSRIPDPPVVWSAPYEAMAREDQLKWPTLDTITEAARSFLDPVLASKLEAIWKPEEWRWLE